MRAKGGGGSGNLNATALNKCDYYKIDSNWTILSNGLAKGNSLYNIVYYDVKTSSLVYIMAKDSANECKFVWLNTDNVSSLNTSPLVGDPVTEVTDGLVSVPEGAKYIGFSVLKTDTETGLYKFELS